MIILYSYYYLKSYNCSFIIIIIYADLSVLIMHIFLSLHI